MTKITPKTDSKSLNLHVYAASVRGAICFSQCKADKKATFELKSLDDEISAFEWGAESEEIVIGNKSGAVKQYNTELSTYTSVIEPKELEGKGAVTGLGLRDNCMIIGRLDGTINLYNVKKKTNYDKFQVNLADNEATVDVMVYNQQRNVVATGGEKNDLKVFDIAKKTEIFRAKSLGKDKLELPIPTTTRGICFLAEDNSSLISTCTKEGMVLLYDERAQRRPVKKYEELKASFTCITPYRDRQCFVGTTKGYLQLLDMRTAKCVKTMQPFAGAVTDIVCHPTEALVVSISLDKHLRIHNVDTKEMLHKEYLKVSLAKLLIRPVVKEEREEEETEENHQKHGDQEFDELFEQMESVDDEPVKLKKRKKSLVANIKKRRT